jgi:hypothetical protein
MLTQGINREKCRMIVVKRGKSTYINLATTAQLIEGLFQEDLGVSGNMILLARGVST